MAKQPPPFPALEIYDRLRAAYGPQHWWPAETPFEVIVGAVLVQNTRWENVVSAIENIHRQGRLDPHYLLALPAGELSELIRPAGVFRVKEKRLRSVLAYLVEQHGGQIESLAKTPQDQLRRELLALHGVGPETADCIVLYAAGHPSFVIDAYTRRALERHGWADKRDSYAKLQQQFEAALPRDATLFNEYHALLVELGKRHCRPKPQCAGCPLECLLPERGLRETP
ncbi:Ultraviolet N-glycosylase/AP lyase [Posidoniimonas polymericola]|uniref:Ultraviolet N-glycosylase/AP lyase n=1 Tax=Posidoniimonas polymericola TaxID=2528002 RepID=A0A5C5ZFN3_9BACT|nr:endonuclease III domain-containing protein [Posidoniimonas polymericola]TWT85837.1 Ultraviolet N-glycosylase/AP lyase [Posidoniimonas polymericola]